MLNKMPKKLKIGLTHFFVTFLLVVIFIFSINTYKVVFETNKNNLAYNMKIINYVSSLNEIFQGAEKNVKILSDTIQDSYNINKFHNENYNVQFASRRNPLCKAILDSSATGEGSWFQINSDLPFHPYVYTWYVRRNGKLINYKHELEIAKAEQRKLTPEDDPYYFSAVRAKKPVWSDIYVDADSKINMMTYSYPIYKNNILIGVAGIDISVDGLRQALKDIQSKFEGSEIFLLNNHQSIVLAQLTPDEINQPFDYSIIENIMRSDHHHMPISYIERGIERTAITIMLANGYHAIISFPSKVAFKGFDTLFFIMYSVLMGLVVLTLIAFSSKNRISEINKKLESEAAKFKEVFNSSISYKTIKDAKGVYIDCNKAFLELYNIDTDDIIGKKAEQVFDKETADKINMQDKMVMESRQSLLEEQWQEKDGEKILLAKYRVPLFDSKGKIIGILVNAIDLTQKAKEQELLLKAKETAEKANLMKSNFLANMSHEIRTPMNGVLGFLQLLEDTELTSEQREYISDVKKSSQMLLDIINEILDFSKIEADKLKIENISFDVRSIIEDITLMATSNAEEKGIEICSLICSDVPQRVFGDPGRVKQILTNLVNNAIKFTQNGDITIHVSQISHKNDDVALSFRVKDTGIGIEEEKLKLIFEAFTQADASTTRKFGGTGLGLAISRKLAALMQGVIEVESKVGEGSTFTLTLPFKKDNAPVENINNSFEGLSGSTVLLVSNNETDIKILKYYLNEVNCNVLEAFSISDALNLISQQTQKISAAIIDYKYKNKDGFEQLNILLENEKTKNIPLIVYTSLGEKGDAVLAKEKGFVGYLSKPIRKQELWDSLLFAISGKKLSSGSNLITRHMIKEYKFDSRAKILIVEDCDLNCKFILKILKNSGLVFDLANNGEEALQAFKSKKYDLILMDCQMPIMDGYTTTREIRKFEGDLRHTPIIALTASAFRADMERCLEAGMDDYLSKPINVDDLMSKISKHLKIKINVSKKDNEETEVEQTRKNKYFDEIVSKLMENYGFENNEAVEFFNQYKEFLTQSLTDVEEYIEDGDFSQLKKISHKLKGASANLTMDDIASLFKEMENSALENDKDKCIEIFEEIKILSEELKKED